MKLELCGPQLNATSTGGPRPRGGVPGDLHGPSGGTESGRAVGGAAERCGALRSWACFGVGNMVDFPGKTMGKYYGTKTTIWEKNYMGKAYRTMMISIRYEKNKGNIVIFSGIEMDLSI